MSILCKNCGQILPENADICPNCETPAPSFEPQDVLAAAFAQLEQQSQLFPESPEPEPPPPEEPPPEETPVPRKKGVNTGLLLLAAVLALMAVLVTVLTRMSPKGGGLTGIAYLNEDYRLMYRGDAKPKTTPVSLSDLSASNVALTADGNYLYYMHSGNLYRADLARAVESGYIPEKIASDVIYFILLQNGGAAYTTGLGENTRLYYYDGWEPRLLADAGGNGYGVSESEKYVYYTDVTGSVSAYYRVPLEEEGAPEKIIDDFDFIEFLSDDVIVYTLDTSGIFGLYAQSPGSERVCITDCLVYPLSISVEEGRVSVTYCAESFVQSPAHDQTCMDLCRYEDGVTTVLAADIHDLRAYSDNIFIYGRFGPAYALEYYQNINGQEFPFPLDKDAAVYEMAVLDDCEAVLKIYKNHQLELHSYTIGETGLTDPAVIAGNFSGSLYRATYDGRDALYYFESPGGPGASGDLIRYCGGEKTTVAQDAYTATILPDSGTVFAMSHLRYSSMASMECTLSMVKDGETTFITDAAQFGDIAILDGNRILYPCDDTLYLWNGKTSEILEENVKKFWVPDGAQAPAETYFCGYYDYYYSGNY